jgi:hypothetical protein
MKNDVLWDVTLCASSKNRCFVGTFRLHHQGHKIRRARNNVSSNYQQKHAAKKYCLEDGILHSHHRENLKFYTALTVWAL